MGAERDPLQNLGRTMISPGEASPESGMRPSEIEARETNATRAPWWKRALEVLDRAVGEILASFNGRPLSAFLPALPAPRAAYGEGTAGWVGRREERGEFLFHEVMRASPAYQRGMIAVARYALRLRQVGDETYHEGRVHLALSRTHCDADGAIPLMRLRDLLSDMQFQGEIVPALARLERDGMIEQLPANGRPFPPDMPRELVGEVARVRVLYSI